MHGAMAWSFEENNRPMNVYVVICVIFFSAVNARNKKTVRSCNFFFPL